jgi:hypothetical protein
VSTFTEISGCFQPGQAKVGSDFEKLTVNHPPVMISNTITRFKIIFGLRLPVRRKKLLLEGYWKDLHN